MIIEKVYFAFLEDQEMFDNLLGENVSLRMDEIKIRETRFNKVLFEFCFVFTYKYHLLVFKPC